MNKFSPQPIEGCDDCAYWTEAFDSPTACAECSAEQHDEQDDAIHLNEDAVYDSKHRFQ